MVILKNVSLASVAQPILKSVVTELLCSCKFLHQVIKKIVQKTARIL